MEHKLTVDDLENILRELEGKFQGKYEWQKGRWVFFGNISSHITHNVGCVYSNISGVGLTPDDVVKNIYDKITTKGRLLLGSYGNYNLEYKWKKNKFVYRVLDKWDEANNTVY